MGLGGLVLGSPLLYLKGMRKMMFQLSGFYSRVLEGSFKGNQFPGFGVPIGPKVVSVLRFIFGIL